MRADRARRDPSTGGAAPAFHPVYLRVLGAVLARRGVDAPALTHAHAIAGDEDEMVPLAPARELMTAAMAATATPWLGLELGAAAQTHTHGLVGSAAFASETLEAALKTIARYAPLRTRALDFEWRTRRDGGELVITTALDLGPARGFVFDAMLVIVERVLQSLSGQSRARARYRLPGPAPPWCERYRDHLEGEVGFERGERLRLQFPAVLLSASCLTADAAGHARAAEACTRLLDAQQQGRGIGERVRMLLAASADRLPDAAEIATRLNLSPRSLHRHLADEGLGLRALHDELRSERARFWLAETDLPVERIAERLGYADASNFARCFRRWVGQTPREYRRERPST